jgi:hypothetical protein
MTKITNSLLKQAIADAEAVRETAVANAKLVLEEAITPQIRDMISRRLRAEAENADADSMEADEKKKDADKEKLVDEGSATEKPFEDATAIGGKDMPADSSEVGKGDNKQPSDDAFDASDIGNGGENKEDSHTDWYDDWNESDFDLTEVIRELEEDIAALSNAKDEDEDGDDDEKEAAHTQAPMGKKPGLKTDGVNKEAPVGTNDADDEDEDEDMDDEDNVDEELDLEAILAELEAEDDEEGDDEALADNMAADKMHNAAPEVDHEKEQMATELARLKGELAQWKEALSTVRDRLEEANLLNAKLLFTNRMFRKDGLTNEQKVRIIESFDRATTVREVKLVYTALVENLSTAAKTYKNASRRVVVEGLASKATPTTAPKSQSTIVENTVAKRLKELAGLI